MAAERTGFKRICKGCLLEFLMVRVRRPSVTRRSPISRPTFIGLEPTLAARDSPARE
jgi:hypothetical protein